MVASSGVKDVHRRTVAVPASVMPEVGSLPLPPRPWTRAYVSGLLVLDLVAALGAGLIGTTARFHGALTAATTVPYLWLSLALPPLWCLFVCLAGGYARRFIGVGTEEYRRVAVAGLALAAGTAIVAYAVKFDLARGYVLVTLPLVLLAIPSILVGFFTAGPMLFGTDWSGHEETTPFFAGAIEVFAAHDVMAQIKEHLWHGPVAFALHGMVAPAFWLSLAGFLLATLMYLWKPELHHRARRALALPVRILEEKYGFDTLWIRGFAGGGLLLGKGSRQVDEKVIDGFFVNGSTRVVDAAAAMLRKSQSGYLYHYAFAMILGLIALLGVLLWFWN